MPLLQKKAIRNRRLGCAAAVTAVGVLVPAAAAPAAHLGERTLRKGARGHDVRELQRLLTEVGVGTTADGAFGPRTARSVRRYERREHLRVDGVVPPSEARGLYRRAGRRPHRTKQQAAATPRSAPATSSDGAYPVQGPHKYGDGFGARGGEHKGQDILARCGTPLVAVKTSTVQRVTWQSAAGRYVVLDVNGSGEDHVYMHLQRADVTEGEQVAAGQQIGTVGQTGNATTCHLHFELWSGPGYYEGGSPRDPLPLLRRLER